MSETLSKMYLELAHVVPEETKTFRELALEKRIEELEAALNDKTRDHRKTVDVKTRPVAKVEWRYRPVTLGDAIKRIEELEAIGKRLLYHDERGQGVGWQEAMSDLEKALGGDR